MRRFILSTFTLILLFTPSISSQAQTRIEISETGGNNKSALVRYHYLFENERFTTPVQEVEFDGSGRGKFRFKRKGGEEIINNLQVSDSLLSQIQGIFNELNFIDGNEDYQHKKDFSHLGTMTITYSRNGRERSVSFNYTDNQSMNRLVDLFRNIATQETRVFEIETVRSADPISTPAQLRLLENELRSKHIADPQRLLPLLADIKMDEGVPLIARNHAERLSQWIKKGK
ncbi:MAG: hypothetical protein L0226_01590 [Acidobacteria bacterium]|nr:hypothetical protein [Acidobacteriota bacterium]MCI0666312.1 hypothetical protein [Acidobacteriota bacterium]